MKADMEDRNSEKYEVDNRSTYCYNALYDGASIFVEGLRVQWERPLNPAILKNNYKLLREC